ncbi:MAG TPA: ABC transporter ATP-binding protein [Actinomycetota bacterium]|jgi:ABC-type polysaccharide/polyol phosphate transport system ATPase subunit
MDALVTNNVTKRYRIGIGRARVREMTPPPLDRFFAKLLPKWWTKDTFNALEDVTLSLEKGSSLGIVGHNGAGKTTFLKVVAGVTAPTNGSVKVNGRVAALIDVGVGLHPELTGTENAYLFGAMQGFNTHAMDAYIERIVEFAEIPDLADTPLKRYSAGMVTRIAFATVAALEADVLLIDEVLAVGDAQFQRKCAAWLADYRKRGGSLVFVSHNLGLVRSMTEHAVWLDHGKVVTQGPTPELLTEYGKAMEHREEGLKSGGAKKLVKAAGSKNRWGIGGARLLSVHVDQDALDAESVDVQIAYEGSGELTSAVFRVGFIDETGRELGGAVSPNLPVEIEGGQVTCAMPLPLRTGIYFPVVSIITADGQVRDHWRLDRPVVVERNDGLGEALGPVEFGGTWAGSRNGSHA